MTLKQLLIQCGFSDKQARTYLALLASGSSPLSTIARISGVKRTSLYNFIDDMIAQGLVHKVLRGKRWYFDAAPPDMLVARQRERLTALEEGAAQLRELAEKSPRPARVTYLEGPAEVRRIIEEELRCKREALYIWPAKDVVQMLGGIRYLTMMDRKRIAKKVAVRSIHFPDKRVYLETGAAGSKNLREVRFAPRGSTITMGVGIYDSGRVGFFSSTGEGFGTLIESEEITKLMRALFESFWLRCQRIEVG